MKFLDCFCGMGGVSDGFALEGFDVTGIDIVDAPKMLNYKHRFIQADMMTLDGKDFQGYDVIWGSPPCRDFSLYAQCYGSTWKNPPNPQEGMKLVDAFIKFVEDAKPRIWILENVEGLKKYLLLKPRMITTILQTSSQGKRHGFWGNFPNFLLPKGNKKLCRKVLGKDGKKYPRDLDTHNKLTSWKHAKIPLSCSRVFAKACKEALELKEMN